MCGTAGSPTVAVVTCSCSFPDRWTDTDLVRTLRAFPFWWAELRAPLPDDVLPLLAWHDDVVRGLPSGVADIEAVHRGWHALAEAGRIVHAAGAGVAPSVGEVVQVSTSGGGVPKTAVAWAAVTARGLVGDRQAARKHHGRPWQALCLWSAEVVDALAADGHPIAYGSAGENLTLRGLDWSALRPGVRMLVGTALVETTSFAIPCAKNARWFSDGDPFRIGQLRTPGSSRIYARVLEEGVVAAGDVVVVEPVVLPVQRPAVALESTDVPSGT